MSNLSNRAMLVRLEIRQWSARKHDKAVSREVAQSHSSAESMGRYNKLLVEKSALDPVVRAAGELRTWLYAQTLPWKDDGARILPAANFFQFMAEYRKRRATYESRVDDFIAAYPRHIEAARVSLNGLFDLSEYPAQSEIGRKFGVDLDHTPLPEATDFRVDIGDIETSRIRSEIEERTNAALMAAHRDLWARCRDVTQSMVDRLSAYDRDPATGKVSHPFRDTLVGNVRDLCELLPRLNLTDDREMERVRQRMLSEIAAHEPAELRDSDTLRKSVMAAAGDILAEMAGYCGVDEAAE